MSNNDPDFDFRGNQSSYSAPRGQGNQGSNNSMPTSPFRDRDDDSDNALRGGDARRECRTTHNSRHEKRANDNS